MDGAELWPWWLWALAVLWIGTSLVWRPVSTATREQSAWIVLAVIYAGLIVFVSRIAPGSAADSSDATTWPLWLSLIAFLISAIACVGIGQFPWQRWGGAGTALLAGVVLALLHAPEAAFACGILAWGLARTTFPATAEVTETVSRQNHWLIGIAAVVTLVVTIGLCRHALVVESGRPGVSRSQTAFPTREWLARQRTANVSPQRPSWEVWGLVVITGVALFTMMRSPLAAAGNEVRA